MNERIALTVMSITTVLEPIEAYFLVTFEPCQGNQCFLFPHINTIVIHEKSENLI